MGKNRERPCVTWSWCWGERNLPGRGCRPGCVTGSTRSLGRWPGMERRPAGALRWRAECSADVRRFHQLCRWPRSLEKKRNRWAPAQAGWSCTPASACCIFRPYLVSSLLKPGCGSSLPKHERLSFAGSTQQRRLGPTALGPGSPRPCGWQAFRGCSERRAFGGLTPHFRTERAAGRASLWWDEVSPDLLFRHWAASSSPSSLFRGFSHCPRQPQVSTGREFSFKKCSLPTTVSDL